MQQEPKDKRLYTRRTFLASIPLGIAGAYLANVVSGGALGSVFSRKRQPPVFSEDSIFAPRKERDSRA